jgi:hypothetical protein
VQNGNRYDRDNLDIRRPIHSGLPESLDRLYQSLTRPEIGLDANIGSGYMSVIEDHHNERHVYPEPVLPATREMSNSCNDARKEKALVNPRENGRRQR